jgi:hypothetical protein
MGNSMKAADAAAMASVTEARAAKRAHTFQWVRSAVMTSVTGQCQR